MSQPDLEELLHSAVRFGLGPAFEVHHALSVLTDERARVHAGWKRRARRKLAGDFDVRYRRAGGHPILWMVAPDLYPAIAADASFEAAIAALRAVPPARIRRDGLLGLLHYPDRVEQLIAGSASLADVIGAIPAEKREWLMYVGLYPYDPASPAVQVMERLRTDPGAFRNTIVGLMEIFWQQVFRDTWQTLRPQLQRSMEESRRLFAASTFAELAAALRLRIEVSERGRYLQAIRGSARLSVDDLETCWILPSAFNDRRLWYGRVREGEPVTAYFPYFDPRISLGPEDRPARSVASVAEPEPDPALIFKALGNATRFAIAALLAQRPRPAAELAQALALSKPTISHHVHLLREAGLLEEMPSGGSVVLSLRSETLENLSALTLETLFGREPDTGQRRTKL